MLACDAPRRILRVAVVTAPIELVAEALPVVEPVVLPVQPAQLVP